MNMGGGGGCYSIIKKYCGGDLKIRAAPSLPLFLRIAFRNKEFMECDSCRMFCRKPHEQSKSLGLIK